MSLNTASALKGIERYGWLKGTGPVEDTVIVPSFYFLHSFCQSQPICQNYVWYCHQCQDTSFFIAGVVFLKKWTGILSA